MPEPRIAVLLSGGGRTLENFLERIRAGTMPGRIVDVIASHGKSFGLERAARAGLPHTVIDPRDFDTPGAFGGALHDRLRAHAPELVLLAGYMVRFPMAPALEGRVMNIHPALLPAYGGRGYYGDRVHEAVLAASETESGCTVHFVDDQYDHGPIILQRRVPVAPDDTPHDLAVRVFEEECEAYPEAVRLFAEGRLRLEGGKVTVLPPAG